ncbi:MAG: pentapeptide repeat-containing protein [Nannocystis sp.]|nr:ADYC domain-containing protein [Nannocystis sp.]MBA3549162.1 pentapeptide repeat-containing protein [Nannocystis sp.]
MGDAGFGAEVSARKLEINTPVLNGPILQGPILQGPILQGIILNGPILQGPILQGPILQGPILQGPILQGLVLNGPILQGPILQGPILQGTLLTAYVLENGEQVLASGLDFVGSTWDIRVGQVNEQNEELVEDYELRIDAIYPSDEQDDAFLYDVVHRPKAGGEWKPLCFDENNAAVPAIPLANYWNLETGDRIDDPNVITFACKNAVLAKCVLWGYRPWTTATRCDKDKNGKQKGCKQVALKDYHQACTRMARADYCGDGTARTYEGTAIDLWDRLSPPVETPTTDWAIEAEWTPDGASCLNFQRHDEFSYPACFLKKDKPMKFGDCGSLKKNRALITSTFDKEPTGDDD